METKRHRHERASLAKHASDETSGVIKLDLGGSDETHGPARQATVHDGCDEDFDEIFDGQRSDPAEPNAEEERNEYTPWLR